MAFSFEGLAKTAETAVNIPSLPDEGGGKLTDIVNLHWSIMYRFYRAGGIDKQEVKDLGIHPPDFQLNGQVWYRDIDFARDAANTVGAYAPNAMLRLESYLRDVLTMTDERREKWQGETWSADVEVKGWGSKKHFYKFQLITLPSFVQALALATRPELFPRDPDTGMRVPIFDLTALMESQNGDEDYELYMLGDLRRPGGKDEPPGYEEGHLFKMRAALWEALGEKNPRITKHERASAPLSHFLRAIAMGSIPTVKAMGTDALWAEIARVESPAVQDDIDTADGQVRRLQYPVVVRFFSSKDEAVEAAGGTEAGVSSTPATNGLSVGLSVPSAWADIGTPLEEYLDAVKAEIDGKKMTKPAKTKAASELGITVEELDAAIEYLGS